MNKDFTYTKIYSFSALFIELVKYSNNLHIKNLYFKIKHTPHETTSLFNFSLRNNIGLCIMINLDQFK